MVEICVFWLGIIFLTLQKWKSSVPFHQTFHKSTQLSLPLIVLMIQWCLRLYMNCELKQFQCKWSSKLWIVLEQLWEKVLTLQRSGFKSHSGFFLATSSAALVTGRIICNELVVIKYFTKGDGWCQQWLINAELCC